ncbi:hypothetical protein U1Q18_022606, partial [Sarracenia purpurea var. burkii]
TYNMEHESGQATNRTVEGGDVNVPQGQEEVNANVPQGQEGVNVPQGQAKVNAPPGLRGGANVVQDMFQAMQTLTAAIREGTRPPELRDLVAV